MYADTALLFPFPQDFGELCNSQRINVSAESIRNSIPASFISEIDLGVEDDLFDAPPSIVEHVGVGVDDRIEAAISLISYCDEINIPQELGVDNVEPDQSERFFGNVFYSCEKNLFDEAVVESSSCIPNNAMESATSETALDFLGEVVFEAAISEIPNIEIPMKNPVADLNPIEENNFFNEMPLPMSSSSGCLSSMDWVRVTPSKTKPTILDFSTINFCNSPGLRRAFSEGDIKSLSNGNGTHNPFFKDHRLAIGNCSPKDRLEKLSRYRNKKTKRNFNRKIKYACRKALADSQPRIRGRFARTDDHEVCK